MTDLLDVLRDIHLLTGVFTRTTHGVGAGTLGFAWLSATCVPVHSNRDYSQKRLQGGTIRAHAPPSRPLRVRMQMNGALVWCILPAARL
ncbi:MAG: hypothetical protein WDZ63_14605 [Burkholderiales bacterium]